MGVADGGDELNAKVDEIERRWNMWDVQTGSGDKEVGRKFQVVTEPEEPSEEEVFFSGKTHYSQPVKYLFYSSLLLVIVI